MDNKRCNGLQALRQSKGGTGATSHNLLNTHQLGDIDVECQFDAHRTDGAAMI